MASTGSTTGQGYDDPSRVALMLRQTDYWRTVYRRTWKGSVITSFVQPLFYVAALGLLLGNYVDAGDATLDGAPSYLAFIAPGLLAAQAMQVATGETMYPVMAAIKWNKTYYGKLATPLRVSDVVAAHTTFVLFRIALSCTVFALVLAPFDVYHSVAGAFGAFLASVLTGMAFATPIYAFSAGVKTEQWFPVIMRLILMPLFLFSGAFFPISELNGWMQVLARITPLWHGVDLARMCTLDTFDGDVAMVHVTYLVALAAAGYWWSLRRLTGRMVV